MPVPARTGSQALPGEVRGTSPSPEVLRTAQSLAGGTTDHLPDPADWLPDVSRWMEARCTFEDDRGTALWSLHNDYNLWTRYSDGLLIRRVVFEALLRGEGFRIEAQVVERLVLLSGPGLLPEGEESIDDLPTPDRLSATQWLRDFLRPGPRTVPDLHAASSLARFSWPAVVAAKKVIGAFSPCVGIWTLPDEGPPRRRNHEAALPAHRREDPALARTTAPEGR